MKKIFTLERKKFFGNQLENRQCIVRKLEKLHIFLDSSSIEIFINDGQEVFTARFFANPEDHTFQISSEAEATVDLQIYSLCAD